MHIDKQTKYGAWHGASIHSWLAQARMPLRIAVNTNAGLLIVPLWYQYADDRLWCCSPQSSTLVQALQDDGEIAFDLSTNEIPYRGIRGRARVQCHVADDAQILESLLARYLGDTSNELSQWLLSRVDNEAVLEIDINWLTSWDFSDRMQDIQPIGARHDEAGL